MDEMAKTSVSWAGIPTILIIIAFYSIFYIAILGSTVKQSEAYKYFKEHPEQLSHTAMKVYSVCPSCGAANSFEEENCPYCATLLKIID